jgi:hypothetical protein
VHISERGFQRVLRPAWPAATRLVGVIEDALGQRTAEAARAPSATGPARSSLARAVSLIAIIVATAVGLVATAVALSGVIPPKSWCAQVLDGERPERGGLPSRLQAQVLSPADVDACRSDPRLPTTPAPNANAFVFSPVPANVRIASPAGAPRSVDLAMRVMADTQPVSSMLDADQPIYEITVEPCGSAATCRQQVSLPPGGGLGIQVFAE